MNYTSAENFILSFINLPRAEYMADPKHCGVYLERMQFLLDLLGNPEKQIPHYIHVTGTSGKGSTVSLLHSILQAGGKKVGSTYSPHPTFLTERWRLGNRYMSQTEFVAIVEQIKPKLDEYLRTAPYDMVSFFEITDAIALLWFAKQKVEWVVLEVGCGGRYDSTNVIPYKDVAVITNIGLDHVGVIGNNKLEIAYEKAGIIKPGCHVFTAEKNPQVFSVIQTEAVKNQVAITRVVGVPKKITTKNQQTTFDHDGHTYTLPTLGIHQVQNARLAIEVATFLNIPTKKIQQGIKNIAQPLRLEIVNKKNPLIILDGAHNADKMRATVQAVQEILDQQKNHKHKKVHLVVGFSFDKAKDVMIRELSKLPLASLAITRTKTNHTRKVAAPADIKKTFAKTLRSKVATELFLDTEDALRWSQKQAKKTGIILVTGSIFVSGELRPLFQKS